MFGTSCVSSSSKKLEHFLQTRNTSSPSDPSLFGTPESGGADSCIGEGIRAVTRIAHLHWKDHGRRETILESSQDADLEAE
jgi:hypothetical protein